MRCRYGIGMRLMLLLVTTGTTEEGRSMTNPDAEREFDSMPKE
jgi:hypothetical protein